jgi:hypothetical protein
MSGNVSGYVNNGGVIVQADTAAPSGFVTIEPGAAVTLDSADAAELLASGAFVPTAPPATSPNGALSVLQETEAQVTGDGGREAVGQPATGLADVTD